MHCLARENEGQRAPGLDVAASPPRASNASQLLVASLHQHTLPSTPEHSVCLHWPLSNPTMPRYCRNPPTMTPLPHSATAPASPAQPIPSHPQPATLATRSLLLPPPLAARASQPTPLPPPEHRNTNVCCALHAPRSWLGHTATWLSSARVEGRRQAGRVAVSRAGLPRSLRWLYPEPWGSAGGATKSGGAGARPVPSERGGS